MTKQPKPPVAPVKPVTDNYFGTQVTDNYRYMENFNDQQVQQWVKAQADFTTHTLAQIPGRNTFFKRMVELDASVPAKVSCVLRLANSKIFYLKSTAQDDVWQLYMRDGMNGNEMLLVDPDKFKQETGNPHAINCFIPSWDGKYVNYSISANGSEEASLYVINTETLENIDKPISRLHWGGVWLPDNQSFVYTRDQEMKEGMAKTQKYQKSKVYLHRLGTDIEQDNLILGHEVTSLVNISTVAVPFVIALPNSDYIFAVILYGTQKELDLYVATLASFNEGTPEWKKICDAIDEVILFEVHGEEVYLLTHKNAPHYKIVKTSLKNPDFSSAEIVMAESDQIIEYIFAAQDALYVLTKNNGSNKFIRITYDGKTESLNLPFAGTVDFFGNDPRITKNDPRVAGILLSVTTWTKFYSIYEYEPQTNQLTQTQLQSQGKYDAPDDLVAQEVEVRSHDGTMIPLSIVHKKGIKLDGSNPCWLIGYGAYGFSMYLGYQQQNYAWYEKGGIMAIAHVRGGGEKGEAWYRAGFQQTKPNTWKDFIACAEYLIKKKYTSPAKLAAEGVSAGGILIGRAVTERPDLFAVAIARVGAMNVIRFETMANGVNNIREFGSCATAAGFKALYEMDAFLHVQNGVNYPAMIIIHGITDQRCEPWQSTKFAARVQAASASDKPILLRIDYETGHGVGSTKTQRLQERADIFAFMMWQFGY
ncbi:MAG: prolyl oligopeptidase family serine peptidase [Pelatocladus maniniholoensis HA4357-MV3]|jgi:prolyl oligopeptidase|uniref:prolyl oligopeptidase n=1 Tax=Pelatocladus maniniholoensis HA4357-MV3 TaxID=1117104 RepID=A0A9E3LW25_9NOST|nr:prolyl oligopeptidase family serine peptidase [Pelatocladus maniniholoensis HA4357-MV3]BAZ67368.1 prolyl oligopeptidase family protein [Fischerella sp. NIES-4106]